MPTFKITNKAAKGDSSAVSQLHFKNLELQEANNKMQQAQQNNDGQLSRIRNILQHIQGSSTKVTKEFMTKTGNEQHVQQINKINSDNLDELKQLTQALSGKTSTGAVNKKS